VYALPGLLAITSVLAARWMDVSSVYQMGYLAASLACVGGITGLASQSTSRIGNALGMIGISTGVTTALCSLNFPAPLLTQALVLLCTGGLAGIYLGKRV
jgi:NAD(P) transhydrogenase